MDGTSCTDERAYRYGEEPGGYPTDERCHDCSTPRGGWHHAGCCVAICRTHADQLLGCDYDARRPLPA
jgi:hypothetical protein